MRDQVEQAVEQAVRARYPGAAQVSLIGDRLFPAGDSGSVHEVEATWKADEELHVGQFVVKPEQADVERRVLAALAPTPVPVPAVVADAPAVAGAFLVMERLPGEPFADVLRAAGMRWELTTLAFSFARALASLHALDWSAVAPWMADPEDLPEDLIDAQVDDAWAGWEARIAALPASARAPFEAALAWLDPRRPVEVSVCLCHGDYSLTNVLAAAGEVTGVVDWEAARVTDASYDLALLAVETARLGLPTEDAELFAQGVLGAYLQSSPRSLGNLAFYTGARLLTETLDAVEAAAALARGDQLTETDRRRASQADTRLAELLRVISGDSRVPWRG